jgi:tryptophan synthase alpha chain
MGVERFNQAFAQHKAEGRKAFIPFTLLGWPDVETSVDIIKTMIDSGVSALELGLPFSDPLADGPIIQSAAYETLKQGFKVTDAWRILERVRAYDDTIPIGLLVYYNMILARPKFFEEAENAGADGVLTVDLPPEMAEEIAEKTGTLAPIFIVSPLTDENRLARITDVAGGFLYTVSRLGITGTEARYDDTLKALITRVKAHTQLPMCVGFGISTPDQAQQMLQQGADGVITGSRVIQLLQGTAGAAPSTVLTPFLQQMMAVCARSIAV